MLDPARLLADLRSAWLSPSLLAAEVDGLEVVDDAECRERAAACEGLLEELKRDPEPLRAFLDPHATERRLGVWFEALIGYWAERLMGWSEVRRNVRIPEGKQTLGEADLLFREPSSNAFEHWELALKYYLHLPLEVADPQSKLEDFVGRQAKDSLDRKLHRIREHQLKLDLSRLRLEVGRRRAFVKGALFYELGGSRDWRLAAPPREVSPGHDRGWWVQWEGRERLEEFGTRGWRVLPKRDWLPAPAEAASRGELASLGDVLAECERIWERAPRPVLVTQGTVRGFVAPSAWAEQMREARRERRDRLHPRSPGPAGLFYERT